MDPEPFNWEEKREQIRKSNEEMKWALSEDTKKGLAFLDKAMVGELSQEEIEFIANKIKNQTFEDDSDLTFCIRVLGEAGAVQYRELVEQYLYYPQNEWVTLSALNTLCNYWGLDGEYLEQLMDFIRGVEWDKTEAIRMAALSHAGLYLRDHFDRELLELMLNIFEDQSETKSSLLKGCTYRSLALAVGKEWLDLPYSHVIAELIENKRFNQIDMGVIEKAKQRLKENN